MARNPVLDAEQKKALKRAAALTKQIGKVRAEANVKTKALTAERDDLWRGLFDHGVRQAFIARECGVTHPAVKKAIEAA